MGLSLTFCAALILVHKRIRFSIVAYNRAGCLGTGKI